METLGSTRRRRVLFGADWLTWPPPSRKIKYELWLFPESTLETNISALREAQHREDIDTLRLQVRDLWNMHHDTAALLECHPHGNWLVKLEVTNRCLPDPVDEIEMQQALSFLASARYLRISGISSTNEQDVLLRNLPRLALEQELDLGDLWLGEQSLRELDKLPCIHNVQCLSFNPKGSLSESYTMPTCVAMAPELRLTLTDTSPIGIAQLSEYLEDFCFLLHLTIVFQWGDVVMMQDGRLHEDYLDAFADFADWIASPNCRLPKLTLCLFDAELYPLVLDGVQYNSSLRCLELDVPSSLDLGDVLPLVQASNIQRVDLACYLVTSETIDMLLDWQLRMRPCLVVVTTVCVLHDNKGFATFAISRIHSKLAHFRELQDPLAPYVWPALLVGMNAPTDSITAVHVVSVDAVFEVLTRCLSGVANVPATSTNTRRIDPF